MTQSERSSTLPVWRRLLRDLRQLLHSLRAGEPDISYLDLRKREALYRLLAENARDIIWSLEFPDRTTYVSPASVEILGWSSEQQLQRRGGTGMLTPESARHAERVLRAAVEARAPSVTFEAEHLRADGSRIWCEVRQGLVYDDRGRPVSTVGVTRDVSEKRALQEQLAQAQKVEAIGVLAGGIAHDFNNFLTVIVGSLELMAEDIGKSDPLSPLLREAQDAAERSTALTGRLLAFTRNQPVELRGLDINDRITHAEAMLRRLVGERVRLDFAPGAQIGEALADENQLDQVLLNLVINARDAIVRDGVIEISTAKRHLDRSVAAALHDALLPGDYVVISVRDDGRGMSPPVQRRAMEPFFSTKPRGQGTGLGLAMVRSILETTGGWIEIESREGRGTTVDVYLPCVQPSEATAFSQTSPEPEALRARPGESILVVEDEEMVRTMAVRILENAGFTVSHAADPVRAIALYEQLAGAQRPPDAVLSDLVMPKMRGTELIAHLSAANPDLCFVLMSGYVEDADRTHVAGGRKVPLLPKPFHADALVRTMRRALDAS